MIPKKRRKRVTPAKDPLARLARLAISTDLPDLADEHDHYAYGAAKRAGTPMNRRSSRAPSQGAERGN